MEHSNKDRQVSYHDHDDRVQHPISHTEAHHADASPDDIGNTHQSPPFHVPARTLFSLSSSDDDDSESEDDDHETRVMRSCGSPGRPLANSKMNSNFQTSQDHQTLNQVEALASARDDENLILRLTAMAMLQQKQEPKQAHDRNVEPRGRTYSDCSSSSSSSSSCGSSSSSSLDISDSELERKVAACMVQATATADAAPKSATCESVHLDDVKSGDVLKPDRDRGVHANHFDLEQGFCDDARSQQEGAPNESPALDSSPSFWRDESNRSATSHQEIDNIVTVKNQDTSKAEDYIRKTKNRSSRIYSISSMDQRGCCLARAALKVKSAATGPGVFSIRSGASFSTGNRDSTEDTISDSFTQPIGERYMEEGHRQSEISKNESEADSASMKKSSQPSVNFWRDENNQNSKTSSSFLAKATLNNPSWQLQIPQRHANSLRNPNASNGSSASIVEGTTVLSLNAVNLGCFANGLLMIAALFIVIGLVVGLVIRLKGG